MLLYIYPERAGIPGLERDCHSSLGSFGDISIPHSGVSRGHGNVPLQSDHRYTPTPDSSGLRRFPNQTPLRSDQALPKCPTSPLDTQEHTQDSPTASCHLWRPPPVKAVITHGNPRDSLANPEPLSANCFVYDIYPLSQINIQSIKSQVRGRYTTPPPPQHKRAT